jgi:acyl-coenzyme A synthetase/AMP-(fatty) acid ligase
MNEPFKQWRDPPTHFNFAADVVERWARQRPDAPALWWVDESGRREQKVSFGRLADQLRRAANFFASLGIRRGERVLVILPRIPQWWTAMLGLIRLGAVPIPGTPLLTARDIAYRAQTAEVNAILTDADGASKLTGFDGVKVLVGEPRAGWADFDAGVADASAGFEAEPTRSVKQDLSAFKFLQLRHCVSADEVIKSAGYRIGPFEVESALVEHPAVVEAAVVGTPDPVRGQIVKAFVVLRPGYSAGEQLVRELQQHCKQVTAPYKYPREIEFVAELPKTISGKIRRVELRQR